MKRGIGTPSLMANEGPDAIAATVEDASPL
jgi:hypothetical protein